MKMKLCVFKNSKNLSVKGYFTVITSMSIMDLTLNTNMSQIHRSDSGLLNI